MLTTADCLARANAAILSCVVRLASAARLAAAVQSAVVSTCLLEAARVSVLLLSKDCSVEEIGVAAVLVNLSFPNATSSSKNRSKAWLRSCLVTPGIVGVSWAERLMIALSASLIGNAV